MGAARVQRLAPALRRHARGAPAAAQAWPWPLPANEGPCAQSVTSCALFPAHASQISEAEEEEEEEEGHAEGAGILPVNAQVGQLAAGATKALGSLWGNFSKLSTQVGGGGCFRRGVQCPLAPMKGAQCL